MRQAIAAAHESDRKKRWARCRSPSKSWMRPVRNAASHCCCARVRSEEEMGKVQKPVEELDEACPECGKPLLLRTSRFGKFISCSGYPECAYKRAFTTKTGVLCPKCGGDLVERRGKKTGKVFYGCANYPTCDFVAWDRPLTVPCPECGGLLTLPNGKEEAVCVKCGALVRGAQEGAPVVVGHRPPEAERPRRPRRAASASADGAGEASGAS